MKKYIVPETHVYKISSVTNLMYSSPNINGNTGVGNGIEPDEMPEEGASGQVKRFDDWGGRW